MASRQTRDAIADQRAADDAARRHVQVCARCRDAKDRKQPAHRCDKGQDLANAARAASRETARQRKLDLAPIPGQMVLPE